MIRRLAGIAVTTALLASGSVVLAPSAEADTPNCVSKREYNRVKDTHYTKARIHRIFDVSGREIWSNWEPAYDYSERMYRKCGSTRHYFLMYRRHWYWTPGGPGSDSHLVATRWRLMSPVGSD